jgi:hypothetical protein
MLGRDHHVLRARVLHDANPFVRIELYRVEGLGVGVVLGLRDAIELAGPFVTAEDGVRAPVDENAELGVAKPFGTLLLVVRVRARGRVALGLRLCNYRGKNKKRPFHTFLMSDL